MRLLIGTYTHGTTSEGIYTLMLDRETGRLSEPELFVRTENPSWMLSDGARLLVANEHGNADGSGEISLFGLAAGRAREIGRLSSQGADPCHLALAAGRLAVTNYTGGSVALFDWRPQGTPELLAVFRPERTGPHPRQARPHPHGACFVDDELWIADLGGDCIYRLDARTAEPRGRIDVPAGTGPRHLTPDGRYLVGELESTVLPILGRTAGPPIASLPDTFTGRSIAAEIAAHGNRLYVSNRGHDSITVIETSPVPRVLQHRSSGGRHPRHFLVTPDGRYLLVANKDSNSVLAMVLTADGRIGETTDRVSCPSPVQLLAAD
ncbi:MAG: lactonase family protein [Pseudomonadales bacterium]